MHNQGRTAGHSELWSQHEADLLLFCCVTGCLQLSGRRDKPHSHSCSARTAVWTQACRETRKTHLWRVDKSSGEAESLQHTPPPLCSHTTHQPPILTGRGVIFPQMSANESSHVKDAASLDGRTRICMLLNYKHNISSLNRSDTLWSSSVVLRECRALSHPPIVQHPPISHPETWVRSHASPALWVTASENPVCVQAAPSHGVWHRFDHAPGVSLFLCMHGKRKIQRCTQSAYINQECIYMQMTETHIYLFPAHRFFIFIDALVSKANSQSIIQLLRCFMMNSKSFTVIKKLNLKVIITIINNE